jgi:hypothetical protein
MTNPTQPRPTFLSLPSDKPVTVAMNTGEVKTIHVLSDGAAGWSWDREHGLQYAVKVLAHEH